MSITIRMCERCHKNTCTDKGHHKFPQKKNHIDTYGEYLLHHPSNIMHLCQGCHGNLRREDKYSEREFLEVMGLFGYCKKKLSCLMNFSFCDNDNIPKCEDCRKFEFDKERYYKEMYHDRAITEKTLIPGSYGYKEW